MKATVDAKPDLGVRSGPGREYRELARVPDGTTVEILEPNPNGGPWVYVAPCGGWVHGDYLVKAGAPARPRPAAGWRLAGALEQLRDQVNGWAPNRKKVHDGTIGDAAHAARASDHNPNGAGVVTAIDITHDPANNCDGKAIAKSLVSSRDRRVKYIIFNGQIWRSYDRPKSGSRPFLAAWMPERYTGPNPHDKHVHISVGATPDLYDDERPWSVVTLDTVSG